MRTRPIPCILLAALLLSALVASPAVAGDEIGIFWDEAYSLVEGEVDPVPGMTTGYLVLKEPSFPGGILGWECRVDIDGPGEFMEWSLAGQNINVGSGNEFQVGIGGEPLPETAAGILLAGFQILATGPGPIHLALRPVGTASIPDAMCYIPAAGPGTLRPMTPFGGRDQVASINAPDPIPVVAPSSLDFAGVPLGLSQDLSFTVRNDGGGTLVVDPAIAGTCPDFLLIGDPGPFALGGGDSVAIEVRYAPTVLGPSTCAVDPGTGIPGVGLAGIGLEPAPPWMITPQQVDFLTVPVGESRAKTVVVTNTGEVPLPWDPVLVDPVPGLAITFQTSTEDIPPGVGWAVELTYAPQSEASFSTHLDLGGDLPAIPVTGTTGAPSSSWTFSPSTVTFQDVEAGVYHYRYLRLYNLGIPDLVLDVHVEDPYGPFAIAPWGPLTVSGHDDILFKVRFRSDHPGTFQERVIFGGPIPPMTVYANVPAIDDPNCLAGPDTLDFGTISVGQVHQRAFTVRNPFLDPVTVAPTSDSPDFIVVGDPVTLGSGETRDFALRMAPAAPGTFQATVTLGPEGCETLAATAVAAEASCLSTPDHVDFGDVPLGETPHYYLGVSNRGPATIVLEPSVTGTGFSVSGGLSSLQPGQSTVFRLEFHPTYVNAVQGELSFGPGTCPTVTLTGQGINPYLGAPNRVGLYFDQGSYDWNEWVVHSGSVEVVTVYLVVTDFEDWRGLTAWECRFRAEGPVAGLGWEIEGQYINIGEGDEFIVGMPDPGLPCRQDILLATGSLLVDFGTESSALLMLEPILHPSLPGQMACIGASDPDLIYPMVPATGSDVVAIIGTTSHVPVEMPAPSARLTAGEVSLQWTPSGDPGDGCHVYRRGPVGETERLTDRPVTATGGGFTYVDRPFGYADGTVLFYSYARVTGGIEGPRSPETEVLLAGMPAPGTKLLANVPNPFNPSTEVRFQLQRPGRVRVAVYDMTGRLVRDLVDEDLVGGPHHRVWDGRDRGGRPVPSGAYYLRLETPDATDHRKMMLLK